MTIETIHTVIIGLGTNQGERMVNLASACRSLPPKVQVKQLSPIYETRPWGFTDQPNFLNQVVIAQTELTPSDLLAYLKQLEVSLGRIPTFRNGPRVIDLDILFYDDLIYESPTLSIPHPGVTNRAFVLAPLVDIAPDFSHPVSGKTMRELFVEVDSRDVKKIYP